MNIILLVTIKYHNRCIRYILLLRDFVVRDVTKKGRSKIKNIFTLILYAPQEEYTKIVQVN